MHSSNYSDRSTISASEPANTGTTHPDIPFRISSAFATDYELPVILPVLDNLYGSNPLVLRISFNNLRDFPGFCAAPPRAIDRGKAKTVKITKALQHVVIEWETSPK